MNDPKHAPNPADTQTHRRTGPPGYDRNIIGDRELYEKVNYIHANPVRRGLAHKPCDWPWSSARWYERREGMTIDALPL